jgi:hypothetical protein
MHTLRDKKNNILTFMLSEKKILNETKTITPLQVKWSVPWQSKEKRNENLVDPACSTVQSLDSHHY